MVYGSQKKTVLEQKRQGSQLYIAIEVIGKDEVWKSAEVLKTPFYTNIVRNMPLWWNRQTQGT